jgi:hypothetical protein
MEKLAVTQEVIIVELGKSFKPFETASRFLPTEPDVGGQRLLVANIRLEGIEGYITATVLDGYLIGLPTIDPHGNQVSLPDLADEPNSPNSLGIDVVLHVNSPDQLPIVEHLLLESYYGEGLKYTTRFFRLPSHFESFSRQVLHWNKKADLKLSHVDHLIDEDTKAIVCMPADLEKARSIELKFIQNPSAGK